ncbi:MAG: hypothetical protein K6F61_00915 [Clostridiales bacterium]|nr:hypothetical protein [Clostridiales bacterium]
MKKLLAPALALLLTLSIVSAMAGGVTFTTQHFTMELPEGWDIDTSDLESESEEGVEALGFFGQAEGRGLVAEAYLVYYEDLKDLKLWDADEDMLKEYAELILEDFEDDNPDYLGYVKAGSVPFILVKAEDEDGEYLYADTITNGYAVVFMVYAVDADGETVLPITDAYVEQFKTILSTFKPAA